MHERVGRTAESTGHKILGQPPPGFSQVVFRLPTSERGGRPAAGGRIFALPSLCSPTPLLQAPLLFQVGWWLEDPASGDEESEGSGGRRELLESSGPCCENLVHLATVSPLCLQALLVSSENFLKV